MSAALAAGLFGDVPQPAAIVGLGAMFTFIGVAVLSPFVARPLATAIGAPARGLGMTGRLGRENAKRNPRRTASTAAALMIGLGLVAFVSVFMTTLKASASDTLDETLRADFILSSSGFQPFSPGIASALSERDEFSAVSPFRQAGVQDRRRADLHRRCGRDDDRRRGERPDGGRDPRRRWPSRGRS